ncbi:MAG: ribonuclease III [Microgenomates group bacterium]
MTPSLTNLQKLLGTKYKKPELLELALIHRSYLNENRSLGLVSNERLEFLGDAVLELWTTEKLYHLFPSLPEGDLTNLRSLIVCTQSLAKVADTISLGEYIQLSRGEESHGGRQNQSILADALESVIGSLYLDQGYPAIDKLLNSLLDNQIKEVSQQKVFKDPKSTFQEIAQSKRGVTPHYVTITETGPDHKKIFEVAAYIGTDLIAEGKGNSKQKAEESAAIAATKVLTNG